MIVPPPFQYPSSVLSVPLPIGLIPLLQVHTVVELHPLDLRSEDGQDVPPGPALRTVVVIDGSTSMAEPHGPGNLVSKLDKIKMFCRLLIQTATEDDHIGIVTFGTHAKVIFPLTEMDSENKVKYLLVALSTDILNTERFHWY